MLRITPAVVALAAVLAFSSSVAAQNPAAGDIGLGKRLYQDKATCGFCHGWSGDGAGDPQSPGKAANLRESKLDHDQLVEIIRCGACPAAPRCRISTSSPGRRARSVSG